ncbi:hypothetical protein BKA66DRAFT_431363 [Pyrenochaeta sp. MPI-SDFR-AT-0127]|nr:hypothetical protein BKA66DRAFT_431363 [Pyrenochaeta sp. MPI-SDFR-AT-0127]
MLINAIRFIAAKKQSPASIQLRCHVKPGVSANRQGVSAVTDESIQVCVAAQARDGEANKAVREVIADALKMPKSDVDIAKGMKSREKTVAVNMDTIKTPEEEIERIKYLLLESVGR